MGEVGQRPRLAPVDQHDCRSAIPGLDDGRERPAEPGRRAARVVAPAARPVADPDLRGHAAGRVHVERDRLEAAHTDREQPPALAPFQPRDVDPVRVDRARLTRGGVYQQHVARHDHAIAADGLHHCCAGPVGRGGDPAELDIRVAQRAGGAHRGVDQRELGAVPRALAGALGDDGDDARIPAPGRLPDVVAIGRGLPELAARDLQGVERTAPLARALGRVDEWDPGRQLGLMAERARAERIGLLGSVARDQQQDARSVGRPFVVLDDARDLGQLPRFAERSGLEREELRGAGLPAIREEGQGRAVRRPARPGVLVGAVRDLAHARAVGPREADPAVRMSLERIHPRAAECDRSAVRTRAHVARGRDLPESGLREPAIGRLDLLVQRRLAQVSFHSAEDRLAAWVCSPARRKTSLRPTSPRGSPPSRIRP